MHPRQWPNLFVVGAAKAGTTSLWRYLDEHPDIFMSAEKEPDFFSARSVPTPEDTDAYLRLFDEAREERLRGEATPAYLSRRSAPEAISKVSPDARIVISLREPVERTHSSYLSLVEDGVEQRSFLQAVQDDLAGRRVSGTPRYVKPKLYAQPVKRYLDAFPGQVFVLFFEDLASDPAAVLRELYASLGVDPDFAGRLEAKPHNQFKQPRNRAAKGVLRASRVGQVVVPRALREPVSDALKKPAPKPQPDKQAVRLLRDAYAKDVSALRTLLDRPLPQSWDRRFPADAADRPAGAAGKRDPSSRRVAAA